GKRLPPDLTGSVHLDPTWFADGMNWLEVDNPDHLLMVGAVHFPPQPCPLHCSPKPPPPETEYFDLVRYHLLSPDVDGVRSGREMFRKKWPAGDPRRKSAELW